MYAVVGSVLVSILGIIALITSAVIVKHRKDSGKTRKRQV
jgi:hypothetical protein